MMAETLTPAHILSNAHRFIETYHTVLQPLCRESGLPPMAVDILLFVANNSDHATARDICQCRGFKPAIVSVHIDRLVGEGLLERQAVPGDRRKTRLVCTDRAEPIVQKGRQIQQGFARKITDGISREDFQAFHRAMNQLDRNIQEIRQNGIDHLDTEERTKP